MLSRCYEVERLKIARRGVEALVENQQSASKFKQNPHTLFDFSHGGAGSVAEALAQALARHATNGFDHGVALRPQTGVAPSREADVPGNALGLAGDGQNNDQLRGTTVESIRRDHKNGPAASLFAAASR